MTGPHPFAASSHLNGGLLSAAQHTEERSAPLGSVAL